jgi:glucose-6-phosphate 1-dehydrogenase
MERIKNSVTIRGSFCIEEVPKPNGIIIFGASGDLTERKLVPSLFNLYHKKLLPECFYVLGCARSGLDDRAFRNKMRSAISQTDGASGSVAAEFLDRLFYIQGGYGDDTLYADILKRVKILDEKFRTEKNHVFYLATPPNVYKRIIEQLGASGLAQERCETAHEVLVVIEKPFGRDLESAMELDRALNTVFTEKQIYRIDHYLGKETVQNILLFRFANSIFEPIWSREFIDNIQITVAESLGVEHRAGYFEQAGLLRDMFQNHMLQMLSLVTMEPPCSFNADRVRDEKVKLLRSIRPFPVDDLHGVMVRGQYGPGRIDGSDVPGYTEEEGVAADSTRETFIAAKLLVDNWRWQGVPVYLRAGKRLARKASKIVVQFKSVPHSMFQPLNPEDLSQNMLMFHVQPEEGISLRIQAKHPGPKLCMDSLEMKFHYKEVIRGELPDAYDRLLLDCMLGDQTLFIRHDDMQVSWSLITPVLREWEGDRGFERTGPLNVYRAGTWGPEESSALLKRDKKEWIAF